MKERKVREAFAIEERKPAMNRDKGVEKSRTWNGVFTWQYIAPFTWLEPVSKFAQFVTTNMTIFCNQLFLALTDVTDVALTDASVKVVLYKRCTFCPVFFAVSTTEEASHSWGETFGDQKRHWLVRWETIGKSWPGQDHSKTKN